jgi:hypothetical protein
MAFGRTRELWFVSYGGRSGVVSPEKVWVVLQRGYKKPGQADTSMVFSDWLVASIRDLTGRLIALIFVGLCQEVSEPQGPQTSDELFDLPRKR